jgi:hypothetical protein
MQLAGHLDDLGGVAHGGILRRRLAARVGSRERQKLKGGRSSSGPGPIYSWQQVLGPRGRLCAETLRGAYLGFPAQAALERPLPKCHQDHPGRLGGACALAVLLEAVLSHVGSPGARSQDLNT